MVGFKFGFGCKPEFGETGPAIGFDMKREVFQWGSLGNAVACLVTIIHPSVKLAVHVSILCVAFVTSGNIHKNLLISNLW